MNLISKPRLVSYSLVKLLYYMGNLCPSSRLVHFSKLPYRLARINWMFWICVPQNLWHRTKLQRNWRNRFSEINTYNCPNCSHNWGNHEEITNDDYSRIYGTHNPTLFVTHSRPVNYISLWTYIRVQQHCTPTDKMGVIILIIVIQESSIHVYRRAWSGTREVSSGSFIAFHGVPGSHHAIPRYILLFFVVYPWESGIFVTHGCREWQRSLVRGWNSFDRSTVVKQECLIINPKAISSDEGRQ